MHARAAASIRLEPSGNTFEHLDDHFYYPLIHALVLVTDTQRLLADMFAGWRPRTWYLDLWLPGRPVLSRI